ncbi:hypothetical protein G7046_g7535 [Stylonectria norvegica]|nr:hypothetical protein G7046_g7535 [Stylonectria norvegica]
MREASNTKGLPPFLQSLLLTHFLVSILTGFFVPCFTYCVYDPKPPYILTFGGHTAHQGSLPSRSRQPRSQLVRPVMAMASMMAESDDPVSPAEFADELPPSCVAKHKRRDRSLSRRKHADKKKTREKEPSSSKPTTRAKLKSSVRTGRREVKKRQEKVIKRIGSKEFEALQEINDTYIEVLSELDSLSDDDNAQANASLHTLYKTAHTGIVSLAAAATKYQKKESLITLKLLSRLGAILKVPAAKRDSKISNAVSDTTEELEQDQGKEQEQDGEEVEVGSRSDGSLDEVASAVTSVRPSSAARTWQNSSSEDDRRAFRRASRYSRHAGGEHRELFGSFTGSERRYSESDSLSDPPKNKGSKKSRRRSGLKPARGVRMQSSWDVIRTQRLPKLVPLMDSALKQEKRLIAELCRHDPYNLEDWAQDTLVEDELVTMEVELASKNEEIARLLKELEAFQLQDNLFAPTPATAAVQQSRGMVLQNELQDLSAGLSTIPNSAATWERANVTRAAETLPLRASTVAAVQKGGIPVTQGKTAPVKPISEYPTIPRFTLSGRGSLAILAFSICNFVSSQLETWWQLLFFFCLFGREFGQSIECAVHYAYHWEMGAESPRPPRMPTPPPVRSIAIIAEQVFLYLTIQVYVVVRQQQQKWEDANGGTRKFALASAANPPSYWGIPGVSSDLTLGLKDVWQGTQLVWVASRRVFEPLWTAIFGSLWSEAMTGNWTTAGNCLTEVTETGSMEVNGTLSTEVNGPLST